MSYTVANLDPDIHPSESIIHDILSKAGVRLIEKKCITASEICDFACNAEAIVAAHAKIDKAVIKKLGNCRVIARPGTGTDNVDHEAATEKGIVVVYVPDFCTEEVANHALMFILALNKKLLILDPFVRRGGWGFAPVAPLPAIKGQVLGLVGFGRIARSLAEKAHVLGMHTISYDPFTEKHIFQQCGSQSCDLSDVLAKSDYVSLHIPLTKQTEKLIGPKQLAMMKQSAYLINCARGGIVDETALHNVLKEGRIAGAALDCFTEEPPRKNNPLFGLENVILTPHSAAYSNEAITYLRQRTYEQIVDVLAGRRPDHIRNPEILERVKLV